MSFKTYIIAEAGVNHNGSVDLARRLIDAAKSSGADAVKFQTFVTDKVMTRNAGLAAYQKKANSGGTQYDMVKALELDYENFAWLKNYADSIGINFLSTPDDEDSLNFLVDELNIPIIKIGSGEVTNLHFLKKIAAKKKPMILSTGMSSLGEVERAVRVIQEVSRSELVLLHCTTNYPCPPNEVNLRAMQTLKDAFKLTIGYSDHTSSSEIAVAAVALGARFLEKHLTLSKNMSGPDHAASLDPIEFQLMVKQIRNTERALGDGIKWPNSSEEKIKPLVRRRIVAATNLTKGTVLEWKNLSFKRAKNGLYAEDAEHILGNILSVDVSEDTPIEWGLVSRL